MPVAPTYPGVYIEEIPSGVRTITGVATSITAFIGSAARGPVNTATRISSYADFERTFGGITIDSALGFAVRDFYRNGGSQAVIVRLYQPSFPDDVAREVALASATAQAQTAADAVAQAAADAATEGADADAVATAAEEEVTAASEPGAAAAAAAAAVAKAARDAVGSATDGQAVATAAQDSVAAAVADAAVGQAPVTRARLNANGLELEAAHEGTWGNSLRARVDHDIRSPDPTQPPDASLFNLSIRDGMTGEIETHRNVSVAAGHLRELDKVLLNESKLARVRGALPAARPTAHAPGAGLNVWQDNDPATSSSIEGSGIAADSRPLTGSANFIHNNAEGRKEGLYALEQVDLFNLLCIAPYSATAAGLDVEASLLSAAAAYCEKRRAMLLVDSPSGWNSKDAAKAGVDTQVGDVSKNAALFFPAVAAAQSIARRPG